MTREILWPRLLPGAMTVPTLAPLLYTIGAPTEMC
jgi:hypothetical protein